MQNSVENNYHSRAISSVFWCIGLPVLLWAVLTPFSGWLDLEISHLFYNNGKFASRSFFEWLYEYGPWPAWIMTGLALAGLCFSFFKPYRKWRNPCLVLLLTYAIGSGLIVHVALKDHWGRPRPRQTIEFGGQQSFRPYYQPNFFKQPEPSKSFTCGHCSTGFTFFSLAILGAYYRRRFIKWLGWSLAFGLGGLLSIARIAQGAHFLTDTLASALIMWTVAWTLSYFLISLRETRPLRAGFFKIRIWQGSKPLPKVPSKSRALRPELENEGRN